MSDARALRCFDASKRAGDVIVALIALILTAPVQVVIALLVRRHLGSPVIFRQERPGRGGEPFELMKFRSMLEPDPASGLVTDADRLVPFGAALRATSLDELPTLWNVLRGDMSVVGPRPLLMRYLPRYSLKHARRHEVRPGLTGLAQVEGRNLVEWRTRLDLDVEYVDSRSWRLDASILARTVGLVVRREGISAAGEATMAEFLGAEA